MKKDLKAILKRLDRIEENQMGQLQGGFAAVTGDTGSALFGRNTNCGATNCVTNCNHNFVVGCGGKMT